MQQPVGAEVPPPQRLVREVAINRGEDLVENLQAIAAPASLSCPDCGGSLWQVDGERQLRFRCHTGHAFAARTLEPAQAEAGENALRSSVRALREREMLLRRTAAIAEATGEAAQAGAARKQADELLGQVQELTRMAASVSSDEPS